MYYKNASFRRFDAPVRHVFSLFHQRLFSGSPGLPFVPSVFYQHLVHSRRVVLVHGIFLVLFQKVGARRLREVRLYVRSS